MSGFDVNLSLRSRKIKKTINPNNSKINPENSVLNSMTSRTPPLTINKNLPIIDENQANNFYSEVENPFHKSVSTPRSPHKSEIVSAILQASNIEKTNNIAKPSTSNKTYDYYNKHSENSYSDTGEDTDNESYDNHGKPPFQPKDSEQLKDHSKKIMATFNMSQAFKMIPEFDGNPMNLHRFIQISEIQYKRAKTVEEKLDFLDVITSKLVGRAYNLILRYHSYDNWQDLKKSIEANFSKLRAVQLIMADVFSLSQDIKETVSAYASRTEKLFDELNVSSTSALETESQTIHKLNETTVLNSFVNGLREPLRLILRAARLETLSAVIDLALQEEKLNQLQAKAEINHKMYCSYCKTNTHNTKNCRRRNNNYTANSGINNFSTRDNRFPKFNSSQSHPTSQIRVTQRIPKMCNYCKKEGHIIDDCRKRLYNNSKNQKSENYPKSVPISIRQQAKELKTDA